MCSALVCPRGLKNEECYLRMALRTTFVSCVALVLPRGFKNNECYMRMASRTTSISCVARLFGFMAESYFLCPLPTDFRWVRWTRARANCLRRIRSSLFANIFNPLAPVNLLLPVLLIIRLALISCSCGDRTQSACEWRRSDSGRVWLLLGLLPFLTSRTWWLCWPRPWLVDWCSPLAGLPLVGCQVGLEVGVCWESLGSVVSLASSVMVSPFLSFTGLEGPLSFPDSVLVISYSLFMSLSFFFCNFFFCLHTE